MDLHNNPNMGTDLLEVKVKQLQDKIKELTQELGNVQNSVDAMASDIQTNTLTASVSVTTENLSASGDVTLGNVTAEKFATKNLEISNIDVDSVTSSESELGNASAEYMNVERDTSTDRMQVKSLLRGTAQVTSQYVAYDNDGNLVPADPTIGIAKWENSSSRANEIHPVDEANVRIEHSLTLDEALENVEEMDTENLLGLDASGKVVTKDTSTFLQKKLTAGYNIDIDEETNTISCDITTMQMKGSVETVEDLPTTGNVRGDVYNVTTTNQNYCWDGTTWFIIGSSIDMSEYYNKTETESAILSSITDTIEAGNTKAVTSDAVNEALSNQTKYNIKSYSDGGINYNDLIPNIRQSEVCYVYGSSANPNINAPNNESNVNYIVVTYNGNGRITQMAYNHENTNKVFIRTRNYNVTDWNPWEKLVTSKNINVYSNYTQGMKGYYETNDGVNFIHLNFVTNEELVAWKTFAELPKPSNAQNITIKFRDTAGNDYSFVILGATGFIQNSVAIPRGKQLFADFSYR